MTAELAVVVFTRDDAGHLGRCLACLRDDPPAASLEIVVFDNASSDHTAGVLAEFDDLPLRVITAASDTSFSRGNNDGYAATSAAHVVFLNPDTLPTGATLDALLATLKADPARGLVGPRLVYPDGSPQGSGWRLPDLEQLLAERLGREREVPADPSGCTDVGWLMGCCVMAPRAVLDEVGGWDLAFWFHGTDLELCSKVRRAGRRVVRVEAAELVHVGHRGWDAERRRKVRQAQRLWMLRDHGFVQAAAYGALVRAAELFGR